MSNSKKVLAIGCCLLAILNSCKDDTGSLGPNVLPSKDLIGTTRVDTTTLITSMYLKDSTSTNSTPTLLLGSYNDPIFGEEKASIYTQVTTADLLDTFPSTPPWTEASASVQIDSAALLLPLNVGQDYYGGIDPQTFVVYQLNSDVIYQHTYYSDTALKYMPSPIGQAQVNLPTTIVTQYDTLRIKLNKSWAIKFADSLAAGAATNWSNATSFANIMHGLYITTSTPLQLPGQGSLANINLAIPAFNEGIYLYFHYLSKPGARWCVFQTGANYQYFTHFEHNYSTTYLGSTHPAGKHDSVNAGQLMYVQSMGGVVGRINFPNLYKNWSKLGPILINEAVLNLPVEPQSAQTTYTSAATFGPPTYLNVYGTNDTTSLSYPLTDAGSQNVVMSNNTYSFTITQYIQSVINGKTVDAGLYVAPNYNEYSSTANGVVLYGAQHGVSFNNKATLTIYYTPITKH